MFDTCSRYGTVGVCSSLDNCVLVCVSISMGQWPGEGIDRTMDGLLFVGWLDGWKGGMMDGWMDGSIHGQTDGWCVDGLVGRWMGGLLDGWMDQSMNGLMEGMN